MSAVEKCPYCHGTIEYVEWGEYPGQGDYWCSNDACTFNEAALEREEERREQYIEDNYVNAHGERE